MSKLIRIFCLLVLAVAVASPALAQDAPPYVQIAHITVKTGMGSQFESIMK